MELIREIPFDAERIVQLDAQSGLETLLVVVKGTFAFERGRPVVAEEQVPLQRADAYRGEPGKSSLAAAGDLAPFKPATDILLQGFAYTQSGSRDAVVVGLRVGALQKAARVVGDREWGGRLGLSALSRPEPFLKLDLTYERAFGGTDASVPNRPERCEENPVGVGFRAHGSRLTRGADKAPNIESVTRPIRALGDRVPPVGFGPVAPDWLPRRQHAGTMDERWRKEVCPLLPADFQDRFHQVAPPDQVYPGYLKGGESGRVLGATPEGTWDFTLPTSFPEVVVKLGQTREVLPCPCDTVVVEPEARRLSLTWRARMNVHGRLPALHWIKVQVRA
jgi:hypothetical protein